MAYPIKYLNAEDFVQMKENISATIFDYEPELAGISSFRLHEEDCNAIAELIMKNLNYQWDEKEN